jgi:hypothetical protein
MIPKHIRDTDDIVGFVLTVGNRTFLLAHKPLLRSGL